MSTSPRLSFKGYKFSQALYRNKDSLKNLIGLLSGINLAVRDWKVLGMTLGAAAIALAVKLLQDAADYFFTEVEI